jgi:hypothetical protein
VGGNDGDLDAREIRWVVDSSVLYCFGLATRLDILEEYCGGGATWTIAVQDELLRGTRYSSALGDAAVAPWLGEPQPIHDLGRAEELRLRLGGRPGDTRHLGEATCIALATKLGVGVLTDDRDAKRLAETLGLATGTSVSILKRAVRLKIITAGDASDLLAELIDHYERRLPRLSPDWFSGR